MDRLAQRYGVLPHELLEFDYGDLLFDMAIAQEGSAQDRRDFPEPKKGVKHGR
jgi:hypothetical protein